MDCKAPYARVRVIIVLLAVAIICCAAAASAQNKNWNRQSTDLRLPGGGRIKAINYPADKPPRLRRNRPLGPKKIHHRQTPPKDTILPQDIQATTLSYLIDSPPIAGFTPYVVISVTDARAEEGDTVSYQYTTVTGDYLTGSPQTDYSVGIFDTGAAAHLMGYANASAAGIYAASLLTPNTVTLTGVTGSAEAWVSEPLGLFIDGIQAVDANGMLCDTSQMIGQGNVSIAVGQEPEPNQPDLPTAIGAPMAVYYAAHIDNYSQVTISHNSRDYNSPAVTFYDLENPAIPVLANTVPLILVPSFAIDVEYPLDLEAIWELIFRPGQPSIITGLLGQCLFFVHSVDVAHGPKQAVQNDRFLFDTGAQVSTIGSSLASILGLHSADPDFTVDIMGANGEISVEPGFFIDSLYIPGDYSLELTNVPLVLLDVSSPEGGYVDGIIGMNLLVDYNLVFRGGGLYTQPGPKFEYEPATCSNPADIAPAGGDCAVDYLDLAQIAYYWLTAEPAADITGDGIVSFPDFAAVAKSWLHGTNQ
ncbi:MAG: aspartyl protease family protein [Planctomycetota bacterium]